MESCLVAERRAEKDRYSCNLGEVQDASCMFSKLEL